MSKLAEFRTKQDGNDVFSAYDAAVEAVEELESEVERLHEQFRMAYRLWLQQAWLDLGELLGPEGTWGL